MAVRQLVTSVAGLTSQCSGRFTYRGTRRPSLGPRHCSSTPPVTHLRRDGALSTYSLRLTVQLVQLGPPDRSSTPSTSVEDQSRDRSSSPYPGYPLGSDRYQAEDDWERHSTSPYPDDASGHLNNYLATWEHGQPSKSTDSVDTSLSGTGTVMYCTLCGIICTGMTSDQYQ